VDSRWTTFPCWLFDQKGGELYRAGFRAYWLHRKFGFDPRLETEEQNVVDNAECLQAYKPILEQANRILREQFDGKSKRYFEECDLPTQGHYWFGDCSFWLFHLFVLHNLGGAEVMPGLHVMDDVGLATSAALRALRDSEQHSEVQPTPSELPTPADVTPSQYQTVWNYAQQMWAPGIDKYKICEHLANGPGNYSECLEDLIPNVGRSAQTNRFHSVLLSLNKEIRGALALEVYRLGEQILVCEVGRKPLEHERNPKQPTTKKSTTKRNR
jgi:hypothetical protein